VVPVPTPPNQYKRINIADDDEVLDIEYLKRAADDILQNDYKNPKSNTSIRPSQSSSALVSSHNSIKSPRQKPSALFKKH